MRQKKHLPKERCQMLDMNAILNWEGRAVASGTAFLFLLFLEIGEKSFLISPEYSLLLPDNEQRQIDKREQGEKQPETPLSRHEKGSCSQGEEHQL
ncbi:hypothetical protein EI42_01794 [Thermosporothrix hazakensis]|uniref:Uncharacterized protein n=1 Tax=Thermosporothrix hazakensis TaxID=644383 RepID=A0A326UA77_THEHA|nr:hypothetical protein EI42_01794 [Thermosporothrix hazakensis]